MLINRAGAGEHIPLSGEELTEHAASKILKVAAPLCSDNWRIYVERSNTGERCRFGVFCGSSDPAALTVDEVILDGLEPGFPIIKIAQSVTNMVELRTNVGDGIEFRFNDDFDVADIGNRGRITELANVVASGLETELALFAGFINRLLAMAIRASHGTLIVVTPLDIETLPAALNNAVALNPPLDLYERYKLHLEEGKTVTSVSRLQAASELVGGFVGSDGVTILTTRGKVLGYRGFVRVDGPDQPSFGGARTRAFAALEGLVGNQLKAAFFKSEDGRMDIKVAPEGPANG